METFLIELFRNIARNIQRLREERNQTQAEFADHCGLSRVQILRAESGRGEVRLPTLAKIAYRNEVPFTELLAEQLFSIRFTPLESTEKPEVPWSIKTEVIESRGFLEVDNQRNSACFVVSIKGAIQLYSQFQNICVEEKRGCLIQGAGVTRINNFTATEAEVLILRKGYNIAGR